MIVTSFLDLLEPAVMAAVTAVAFAFLFSVPARTLLVIALLGALGVTLKLSLIAYGWSIVGGTFVAACSIGLCSMWLAWRFHAPSVVFSLPAVIPMVPGVFAYRTMIGVLAFSKGEALSTDLLMSTISNGLTTAFLFLCLALGVSLPNLLLRGRSIRDFFGHCPKQKR